MNFELEKINTKDLRERKNELNLRTNIVYYYLRPPCLFVVFVVLS